MQVFRLLFILFCLNISFVHAYVQNDTYTCIASPFERKVVVIDRKTGFERILDIGQYTIGFALYKELGYVTAESKILVYNLNTLTLQSTVIFNNNLFPCFLPMKIYKNHGYVVSKTKHLIYVIDLKTYKVSREIQVGTNPHQIEFHNGLGYIQLNSSRYVSIIDLTTHTLLTTLELGSKAYSSLCIHNELGYSTSQDCPKLSIFDLKSGVLLDTLHIGRNPLPMVVHQELGYIVNTTQITVIDLATQKITSTIPTGMLLGSLVIDKNYGYAKDYGSNAIAVIDLKTRKLFKTISLYHTPSTITIHRNCAYVIGEYPLKIDVINLHTFEVIQTIENPQNRPLDFSDSHVYLGVTKICPLPKAGLVLFDHPYTGIDHPISCEDGDQAFSLFESAVKRRDNNTATAAFNIALACGHKKAYAVAFKAFCHGYWGAIQSDEWAKEFSLHADHKYLQFIKNDPYCFSLISPDQDTSFSSSCAVQ